MGLFDSLVKAGLNQLSGNAGGSSGVSQQQLVEVLLQQVLGKQESGGMGGLGNLRNMLERNGLGDAVNSWISTGNNQPIDGQQLQQGFDLGVLANVAERLGLSNGDVATQLSKVLPDVVDKLTPQGQVDDKLALDSAIGVLGKLLK